jgi:predicted transcriptional regulator
MTAVKDILMERLQNIENEEFLNNLLVLIENVDENGVFQFSTEQMAEIDESIEQIKRGEFKTHEEVMNKFLK